MEPKNFPQLVVQLFKQKLTPNTIDTFVMRQLIQLRNGIEDESTDRQLIEWKQLVRMAIDPGDEFTGHAQQILLSLHYMEVADDAKDRERQIRICETILSLIDRVRFPVTAAFAHLKIGGAICTLPSDVGDSDSRKERLRTAITHFSQGVELLPAEVGDYKIRAHFDAATAYYELWKLHDDWDDDPDDARASIIRHGMLVINAINDTTKFNKRESITLRLLEALLADGNSADARSCQLAVELLDGFLESSEGKLTSAERRHQLNEALAYLRTRT